MFKRPAALLLVGAAGLLAACSLLPIPGIDSTTPPAPEDFKSDLGPDPFEGDDLTDVSTPTKFAPTLAFELQSLKAGEEPAVTINVYQTKSELEIRRTETVIEHAGFRFDKLEVGKGIGYGKFELGTPPKLTFDVSVRVTSTDGASTAQLSVKANNPLAEVYVADLQIQTIPGGLSITSIGNATRADDEHDTHTTQASARLIQTLYPGYVVLPGQPGPMRTRTVITSEPDPANQQVARKVFRPSFTIE